MALLFQGKEVKSQVQFGGMVIIIIIFFIFSKINSLYSTNTHTRTRTHTHIQSHTISEAMSLQTLQRLEAVD